MERDLQLNFFGEASRSAQAAFGATPDQLVAKWSKLDPRGYADSRMTPRKKFIAAILQENMARSMSEQPHMYSMNMEAISFFRDNGMLSYHKELEHAAKGDNDALCESLRRKIVDATTTAAVPTIAVQFLPMVTRAVASNPIMDLVVTIPMTGPSANIVYEDFLYDDNGAYSDGTRVDTNDDPTYSDRTDCTAAANEIRANYQRETMTATEKVLAAQICLAAEQDAQAQFGVSIEARLRAKLFFIMMREWARLVADDIRTMASNTSSYSNTVPAPYTSLNTNEYRKVLAETCVVADAAVQEAVYEPTKWLVMTPTVWSTLERTLRFEFDRSGPASQSGVINQVSGEQGSMITAGRWDVHTDPYFAANTILGGITQFTQPDHAGQAPYYFGAYHMAENVSMLFLPRTQVIELGGQTRAARKMVEPGAYFRVDITA